MSASLVGSEMCIRDSGAPGHGVVPGLCSGWVVGGWGMAHSPPCWGHPGLCLLYTSDAADDM
eukprot:6759113-Alexandrium_andersonii.AAC.1